MSASGIVGAGLRAAALVAVLATGALAQGPNSQGTTGQGGSTPSPAQQAQQERMRSCNTEAGTRNLAGEARRSFMSECLAGRMPPPPVATGNPPNPAQQAQQDRMRTCNAEAGSRNLAGEARRGFMSECLSGRMPASQRP
ncbi:PsiF family protein [Paracraurococcus ruber]|uniref:PsiF repeat-containing protein n=1 Tax=Paracraurococcus ruber TaxID=77675 RepID=A0ABS1CU22_9PROT|nr:PsiF family protein [Paracraurococcus ruber]MBK1657986.1 hypothetical protein [Paracraurococcus ruber]TDG30369.1 phosphate-starvation-inducible protein PsiF [Paracraurococcus ruber]